MVKDSSKYIFTPLVVVLGSHRRLLNYLKTTNMDEETKRQILELTRQLHQLGCEVGMDNNNQLIIYTGVEVLDENSLGWHQTRGYVHGSFVNPKSFTRQPRLPSSFIFVKVISFTRQVGGGRGENSWRKVRLGVDGNHVST